MNKRKDCRQDNTRHAAHLDDKVKGIVGGTSELEEFPDYGPNHGLDPGIPEPQSAFPDARRQGFQSPAFDIAPSPFDSEEQVANLADPENFHRLPAAP